MSQPRIEQPDHSAEFYQPVKSIEVLNKIFILIQLLESLNRYELLINSVRLSEISISFLAHSATKVERSALIMSNSMLHAELVQKHVFNLLADIIISIKRDIDKYAKELEVDKLFRNPPSGY